MLVKGSQEWNVIMQTQEWGYMNCEIYYASIYEKIVHFAILPDAR